MALEPNKEAKGVVSVKLDEKTIRETHWSMVYQGVTMDGDEIPPILPCHECERLMETRGGELITTPGGWPDSGPDDDVEWVCAECAGNDDVPPPEVVAVKCLNCGQWMPPDKATVVGEGYGYYYCENAECQAEAARVSAEIAAAEAGSK